jgi:hypothetical protein
MRDAFVSYATRDSRRTLLVCAGLQALGISLWLDAEELTRSRAAWREAVQTGIATSRTVLVTLSEEWAASPACRYELAIAVQRRKPFIGVALGTEPKPPEALALLPPGVELIDADGSVGRAIELVGARLAV